MTKTAAKKTPAKKVVAAKPKVGKAIKTARTCVGTIPVIASEPVQEPNMARYTYPNGASVTRQFRAVGW